jgi:hypothetical protein
VLSRKVQQVPNADMIDLLLDSDEPTRKLLIFQALQTGALKKSEAEQVIAQVARLERAAAPRTAAPRTASPRATSKAAARAA